MEQQQQEKSNEKESLVVKSPAKTPSASLMASPSYNDLVMLATGASPSNNANNANNNGAPSPSPSYLSLSNLSNSNSNLQQLISPKRGDGGSDMGSPQHSNYIQNSNNSSPINEKVASLASSIYTELEKIVKGCGRDTVKDLMPIVVNVLEALDSAYQEKEEQVVENELLKDDYEKLLSQYEREKQSRKDSEMKLFQSEDSFAEQKRDYDDKIKSLESIVRMIDLKSKNTSDHVIRLEEKENELKREYAKLHDRYTELFKTHCDYMERTKILFGNDSVNQSNTNTSASAGNTSKLRASQLLKQQQSNESASNLSASSKQLLELLRSNGSTINRSDLLNALKATSKADINQVVAALLSIDNQLVSSANASNDTSGVSSTSTLKENESSASLSSLVSQRSGANRQQADSESSNKEANEQHHLVPTTTTTTTSSSTSSASNKHLNDASANTAQYVDEGNELNMNAEAKAALNLQGSENFDEHLSPAYVEFDDNGSDIQGNQKTDLECEEDENLIKNDLSLFNELSRENYDITELDDGADLTGMTREVANLIRENSELLQTKHALNVLKDDLILRLDQFSSEMVILREEIKSLQTVKAALQLKISELEEEAKKNREELAERAKKQEEEDENVPMAQRKRFTRAEMARVLMERNQYKEKLMDLQEAVRWTEMMRASKLDPSLSAQTLKSAAANHPNSQSLINSASNSQTAASGDQANDAQQEHKKKTPLWKFFSDLFGSSSTGSSQASYTIASKSQNQADSGINRSILKPIVKPSNRDDGRMQAYGWSLPSKSNIVNSGDSTTNKQSATSTSSSSSLTMSIPVPVYCRPLFEQDNDLKLSCATTISYAMDLNLDKSFTDLVKLGPFYGFDSTRPDLEFKSSCIWICNLNSNDSHICILDANKPSDLIHQFTLKDVKILSIASIGGAYPNEYPLSEEKIQLLKSNLKETNKLLMNPNDSNNHNANDDINFIECSNENLNESGINNDASGVDHQPMAKSSENAEKSLSTFYPTMWLGSQEGWLFIHSSVSNVSKPIEKLKLKDAILCIVQNKGRVIVGLADGTAALFHRSADGLWDLKNFYVINFGKPHHSIRTLANVYDNVWCACRNKIFVINPDDFRLLQTIEVHPRRENQVRHMTWCDQGVWVSIRLDSTLRLYHAKTFQNIQYLDIEPFITRMLGTSNLGLSLVRISSLLTASKRLWIGTGNGVILSFPISDTLKDDQQQQQTTTSASTAKVASATTTAPGSAVRVTTATTTTANETTPGGDQLSNVPYCNLSEAQFSFHGHRDAIKFFLNVPSQALQKNPSSPKQSKDQTTYERAETSLVLSGGHGYIDFRIGDTRSNNSPNEPTNNESKSADKNNKNERSHLIVWQVNSPQSATTSSS